jgi:hypothetical protein
VQTPMRTSGRDRIEPVTETHASCSARRDAPATL